MQRYRNLQNLPNSPLSPLIPMQDNTHFQFNIGGDGSLDKYIYGQSLTPKGSLNRYGHRGVNAAEQEQLNTPKARCSRCRCEKGSLKLPKLKFAPLVRCSPVKPKPISEILSKILVTHGLLKYIPLFENEEIDLDVFCTLSQHDLRSLGILDPTDQGTLLSLVDYARCI